MVPLENLTDDGGADDALTCVWIGNETVGLAEMTGASNGDFLWVGREISTAQALKLGRAGITAIYDIDRDTTALTRRVLDAYSRWREKPRGEPDKPLESVIIGDSPVMTHLRETIARVAGKDKLMVLLRGETGTGKGLAARMIHDRGGDPSRPFIEINCTAIPDTLVEAELFGHEKGAFTDAHRSRRGIFELAHGGTLFLDEIGYLRTDVQAKLLKVLEDRRFRRVGGETDIQVDCRIITGTSVNLEKAVKENRFRRDLYYRLNVFPVHIPPLRTRREDIPALAEYFRNFFSREHTVTVGKFTKDARQYLVTYDWPGNVRELKHQVERAVILCDGGEITGDALRPPGDGSMTPDDGEDVIRITIPETGKSLDSIQGEIIRAVLAMTGGNRSEAARLLNISRSRLLRHIATDGN